ncbi:MAG TPA: hypothetical protein VE111_04565 [Bradyrhizobium sp.]|nr:hypothetical protein [Bradyrhizobium sp.]
MRWFRTHELFLGVFLTVAVFALGFVVASSVPPPSQQIEKTDHQQTANEGAERTAEKQIAYYTKWLAWFTGALVAVSGIQGYFLLRADKTARIVANAADLSARAAVAIELPTITAFPEYFSWGVNQDSGGRRHYCSVGHIAFYNHGRTDAYLSEIKCGWIAGNSLPDIPMYQFTELINVEKILGHHSGGDIRTERFEFEVSADLFDQLRAKTGKLWLFCCLVYTDFLQNTHETCFCWERWQTPGAGGFNIDTTESYNRKT